MAFDAPTYAWRPQAGPQALFVAKPMESIFEVVYGGARGGGKTDATLGEFALHAKRYGADATRMYALFAAPPDVGYPTCLAAAPDGTSWVVGTELNLVSRLRQLFPAQKIAFLEKNVCYCSTMNRIDLPHLVWVLESLVDGRVVNPIVVDPDVAHWARVALEQMLALPGVTSKD